MAWPRPSSLPAVATLALAVLALPALAHAAAPEAPPAKPSPPAAQGSSEALPIYSSDGKRIGRVLAVGRDDNGDTVVVAEIERSLGFGATVIAVPLDLISDSTDRIQLTITAAEVNARLGR